MITKAIVEEVITPYQVKVRIPLLDRITSATMATSNENLNIATICSLPNCYINVQVGDVVFVGFEDNTYYKAVILGHLCRQSMTNTYPDLNVNTLTIRAESKLPYETTIGEVTAEDIKQLQNTRDNIQKQIDNLQAQLNLVMQQVFPESDSGGA